VFAPQIFTLAVPLMSVPDQKRIESWTGCARHGLSRL